MTKVERLEIISLRHQPFLPVVLSLARALQAGPNKSNECKYLSPEKRFLHTKSLSLFAPFHHPRRLHPSAQFAVDKGIY
jgi:hypothetical protein